MEFTFFMVKPDAVMAGYIEGIIRHIKENGFKIVARKQKTLTRDDVAFLCPMHVGRDFFDDLVAFFTSGPSELFVLRRRSAIEFLNKLVGETDPKHNSGPSLRKRFGTDVRRNAVHSPSNEENAVRELAYFFPEKDWY